MDDDEGIKKYFAAFHLHDTFPAAVVIDDFGNFFDDRYILYSFNYLFCSILIIQLWYFFFFGTFFKRKELPREIW